MKYYLQENMSNLHLELDINRENIALAIDKIYSHKRVDLFVIKLGNEPNVMTFDDRENAVAYLIDRLITSVVDCVNAPNLEDFTQ